MSYIVTANEYSTGPDADRLGGKAGSLFYLQRNGIRVPEFICISTRAFQDHIQPLSFEIEALLQECDFENYESLCRISNDIKQLVNGVGLSDAFRSQLHDALEPFKTFQSVSVRSSAANEDGLRHSFAGQLRSWLNVPIQDVEEKVKACWSSTFEPGVLSYLHRIRRFALDNPVAVIVQRMVESRSSGVLFQADPRGGTHKQVICAGYGLGEGVVSDKVETDLYVYDTLTATWRIEIAEKDRYLLLAKDKGVKTLSVPPAWRNTAVLNEAQREQLMQQSQSISALTEHYQDIEWSFDESGTLYILQSRAITTVPRGYHRVFDSSNIMESYPGVVLPMTFSILHLDYYCCLKNALRRMGVSKGIVARHDTVLRDLVGYINGRSYYNINNWYRTLLLVPYFKQKIIKSFEQMIGSDGSFSDRLDDCALSVMDRAWLAILFPVKFMFNLMRHDALIRDYFRRTDKLHDELTKLAPEKCSADELIAYLNHYPRRFMQCLSIPIINDFYSMIFMAVTRERLTRKNVNGAQNLINGLLAHQHIESIKPLQSVQSLANAVSQSMPLRQALHTLLQQPEHNRVTGVVDYLISRGETVFASRFKMHIEQYGYRCPRELIMEADTYLEDPFQLLRTVLDLSDSSMAGLDANTSGGPHPSNHYAGRSVWLRWLLHKTKKTIAYRESTRLDRGRLFAQFRILIRHLGERLVDEGVLENAKDVFLFTLDELDAYRKACTANTDLNGLARYRRDLVADWRRHEPEQRVFTKGLVYANKIPEKRFGADGGGGDLAGTGCSPGQVTAQAAIVRNPNAASNISGKILVTETTDPGWVFLMTQAGGLISERGSLLSHTAIIGRELGLPTIVGVKNATRIISEGNTVTMDGETGAVSIRKGDGRHEPMEKTL